MCSRKTIIYGSSGIELMPVFMKNEQFFHKLKGGLHSHPLLQSTVCLGACVYVYMIPPLKSVFSEKEVKEISRMLQSFYIIEFFVFPIR